ncbi:PadR family transcriptional regulator [Micrococcoides hystricis]|uniref:PadR family transcriptional regulator n=1 Tax=Micrococcoides hystricis TaxID=1572761 RepID=A0ABV6PAH8_9MICC
MISGDVIRGTIDLLVLDSVLDEPSYGYAISKRIESRVDGRYEIKETTLNSAMRRLERAGVLESYKDTSAAGRPRTYYRIAEAGREFYWQRRAEWLATVEIVSQFIREEGSSR